MEYSSFKLILPIHHHFDDSTSQRDLPCQAKQAPLEFLHLFMMNESAGTQQKRSRRTEAHGKHEMLDMENTLAPVPALHGDVPQLRRRVLRCARDRRRRPDI
jgi:hypothetical protein